MNGKTMDAPLKKILRALSLELRHTLEGSYSEDGTWHAGDLERRLNQIGIWRARPVKPISEMPNLSPVDRKARELIDAYLALRSDAGVSQSDAVAEFIRESAYSWANRLFALRSMEARGIIDPVILQEETYQGRSMVHNRFAQRNPAECTGEDDGLFAMLSEEFQERSRELPDLFAPDSPAVALRPSVVALKHCITLLSGSIPANGGRATDDVFTAPDAFGWAYQYWNAEEKDRVFEMVRTRKGAKIEGSDIIPATQLYTEPYMVKFLVQNSLGATWMMMHPESKLSAAWDYYVKDADRTPNEKKPVAEVTFLDPACGSGHFLIEAFDLFFTMYEEEGQLKEPAAICRSILNNNLFGIDIDERAVQITKAVLWMKAAEMVFAKTKQQLTGEGFLEFHDHIIATNIRLPHGKDHLDAFLKKHPEDVPLRPALLTVFEGLQNVHELGSLLQIEEPVEKELKVLKEQAKQQKFDPESGEIVEKVNFARWKQQVLKRLKSHFQDEAEKALPTEAFFSQSAVRGLALFDLLARRYDVVAANPPYMGDLNMSHTVKNYLLANISEGSSNLFAAFIIVSHRLSRLYSAMVVQRVLLYNQDYEKLRKNIMQDVSSICVAVIGPGGFEEISGEMVNTALLVTNRWGIANNLVQGSFINLLEQQNKSAGLQSVVRGDSEELIFRKNANDFKKIWGNPWAFDLGDDFLELMGNSNKLGELCPCRSGISTGNDDRFLRCLWEIVDRKDRWQSISDGGQHERWWRTPELLVDCEYDQVRPRFNLNEHGKPRSALRNMDFQGRKGITYLKNAGRRFAGRILPSGTFFLDTSRSIFPNQDMELVLGLLNSRSISNVICSIGGGGSFVNADIERLPLNLNGLKGSMTEMVQQAINTAYSIEKLTNNTIHPLEDGCLRQNLKSCLHSIDEKILQLIDQLDDLERRIDENICFAYNIIKVSSEPNPNIPPSEADVCIAIFECMILRLLGHRWPKQIEAGEPVPEWADPDGIIPITSGLTHPTLLQQVRDRIAAEFPGGKVNEIEKQFEEVVGMSLDRWLAGEFFKHHISQFKKRPVAWQLSSSPSGTGAGKGKGRGSRREPAFSCLVYYHKIDVDILHKIRTQYIGDLINRYGTELRGLEGRKEELTGDQATRKVLLDNWIAELKAFAQVLQDVADAGFDSAALKEIVKKEPLDKWTSHDGKSPQPKTGDEFYAQEKMYDPDINDGVRVNIAPLQKAGLLAAEVIAKKDVEKAIADRAEWRADERRWCREGKLPKCGWWD